MATILPGEFLVKGTRNLTASNNKDDNNSSNQLSSFSSSSALISDTSLSFWGGIDPITGIVVDTSHPLCGICLTDTILCLPSGRGSCTASQVLLELILNSKAPKAFCFRDVDGLACVGAIVAQEVFTSTATGGDGNDRKNKIYIPDMIHIGNHSYQQLLDLQQQQQQQQHGKDDVTTPQGCILPNGDFILGRSHTNVEQDINRWLKEHYHDTFQLEQFTNEEQELLDACTTEAQKMAYRVIFRYAHLGVTGTETPTPYLDITQGHIDGCTYIGPGGLEFAQRLVQAKGRVQVPTTLNSVSADRRHHEQLGVPATYAANSIALGDAYLSLGCTPSFTCAPYLLSTTAPKLGDQIAWGESNAVVYANSVIGARTEKYADYLDICCAITGKIPATGVHLDDNRKPQIVLDASNILDDLLIHVTNNTNTNDANADDGGVINLEMLFPTLGHVCGNLSDGKVPVLVGFDGSNNDKWASLITNDHLKAFCAAFGTTGTSPLVHIEGITPETKQDPSLTFQAKQNFPIKEVTWTHCQGTFELLNNSNTSNNSIVVEKSPPPVTKAQKIDLVALGNPHLSVQECHNLVLLIKALASPSSSSAPVKKHPSVRIMACLSREIYNQADEEGYIDVLKEFGVEFINDTCWCMLLDPPVIPSDVNATILTNSGKYAHYGPGLTDRAFRYGSTADCVLAAITGEYPSSSTIAVSNPTLESTGMVPTWLKINSPALSHQQKHQQVRSFSTLSQYESRTYTTFADQLYALSTMNITRANNRNPSYVSSSRRIGRSALQVLKKILIK